MTETSQTTAEPEAAPEPRPIESATASTACQTNGSIFPYVLAGSALAAAFVVIAVAIVLLFSAVSDRYSGTASAQYGLSDGYSLEYGYGDGSESYRS